MATYASLGRWPLAAQLAGFLSARDAGTGRLNAELGSMAAIREYQEAVAQIQSRAEQMDLRADWDAGVELDDEPAITRALA
jgi:hypothetical protein